MRRAVFALLAALALVARPATGDKAEGARAGEERSERDSDLDDDSDSAPFMIVVEFGGRQRCSGSLVSLRTALTSAACVREARGELWARAPPHAGAGAAASAGAQALSRRVARVATPAPAADLDLAVLELEAPFGARAHSRPILMATRPEDCDASAMCHVVRALGTLPRLRIVDAELMPGPHCATRALGWQALRDSALCLTGPTLCASDRGAGVVCGGKLCGVLSGSARTTPVLVNRTTEPPEDGEAEDPSCGDTHVAQSVARWRRFLHCAHTLRACGRGGECAQLCSERQLVAGEGGGKGSGVKSGEGSGEGSSEAGGEGDETRDTDADTTESMRHALSSTQPSSNGDALEFAGPAAVPSPSRRWPLTSATPPRRGMPTHTPGTTSTEVGETNASGGSSPRLSFEFEPNRADFKAGEYGDNAADYGGDESGGGGAPPPRSEPASSTRDVFAESPPPITPRFSLRGPEPTMPVQESPTPRANSYVAAAACVSPARLDYLPFIFVTVLLYIL